MTNKLMTIAAILISFNTFALGGLHETGCKQSEVDAMYTILENRTSVYESGLITELEVAYANCGLMDVQVCAGVMTKADYCKAMLKELNNIMQYKYTSYQAGMINKKEVDYAHGRILALEEDCK